MPPIFCHACLSTSLSLINSVYVCDQCGTQSQFVEEDNDGFEMSTHARRRHGGTGASAATLQERAQEAERHKAAMAAAAAAAAEAEAAQVVPFEEAPVLAKLKTVAELYLRALQGLVRAQADALVERFGGPPECRAVMRNIWFSFVPLTGLLDMDPRVGGTTIHAYLDTDGLPALAREGLVADGYLGAGSDLYGKRRVKASNAAGRRRCRNLSLFHYAGTTRQDFAALRMDSYIRSLMPPSASLVMTLLTCLLLRMPVCPVDVVRWAVDEALPYHDLEVRSRPLLTTCPLKVSGGRLLRATGSVPPRRLLVAAVEMAGVLGLRLPPLNVDGLLAKMTDSLGLPRPVFLVSRELHRLYQLSSPLLHPNALGIGGAYPYLPLTALLFCAIKLCYGLDNRSAGPPPSPTEDSLEVPHLKQQRRSEAAATAAAVGGAGGARAGAGAGPGAAAAAAGGPPCEVAPPLLPGVPPLELPPGGWTAWAAMQIGPCHHLAQMPITTAPHTAWEASHLPPGELHAFVEASAQRLSTCSYRIRNRNTRIMRRFQEILGYMSEAAWAAQAPAAPPSGPADAHGIAAAPPLAACTGHGGGTSGGRGELGDGEPAAEAGGGAAAVVDGTDVAAAAAAAAAGSGGGGARDHVPVAIAVSGPQAAALAGLPRIIQPAADPQPPNATRLQHQAQPQPRPECQQRPGHAASASAPSDLPWPDPSVVLSQLHPRGSGLAENPDRVPPLKPWLLGRLVLPDQHMHADTVAVLGALAWLQSVTFQDMLEWVQALLAEMEEMDVTARRAVQLLAQGRSEEEALQWAVLKRTVRPRRGGRRGHDGEAEEEEEEDGDEDEEEADGKEVEGLDRFGLPSAAAHQGGGRGRGRVQGGNSSRRQHSGQEPRHSQGRGKRHRLTAEEAGAGAGSDGPQASGRGRRRSATGRGGLDPTATPRQRKRLGGTKKEADDQKVDDAEDQRQLEENEDNGHWSEHSSSIGDLMDMAAPLAEAALNAVPSGARRSAPRRAAAAAASARISAAAALLAQDSPPGHGAARMPELEAAGHGRTLFREERSRGGEHGDGAVGGGAAADGAIVGSRLTKRSRLSSATGGHCREEQMAGATESLASGGARGQIPIGRVRADSGRVAGSSAGQSGRRKGGLNGDGGKGFVEDERRSSGPSEGGSGDLSDGSNEAMDGRGGCGSSGSDDDSSPGAEALAAQVASSDEEGEAGQDEQDGMELDPPQGDAGDRQQRDSGASGRRTSSSTSTTSTKSSSSSSSESSSGDDDSVTTSSESSSEDDTDSTGPYSGEGPTEGARSAADGAEEGNGSDAEDEVVTGGKEAEEDEDESRALLSAIKAANVRKRLLQQKRQ